MSEPDQVRPHGGAVNGTDIMERYWSYYTTELDERPFESCARAASG